MAKKTAIRPKVFPWLDYSRYTFSLGAEKGGLVFISGQAAAQYDPARGGVVCSGDMAAQTRTVYEKLKAILAAAGLGFENVVRTVDYIPPHALASYRDTAQVRREYFKDNWSAASVCLVESLLRTDALIEIDAIAVRDLPRQPLAEVTRPGLTYVPGVKTGPYIWMSALAGRRPEAAEGKDAYAATPAGQAEVIYQRLGQLLARGGARPQDVVKTYDYLAAGALPGYRETAQVRRDFFQGTFPAAMAAVSPRLLHGPLLMEMEGVVVGGEGREDIIVPEWEPHYRWLTFPAGVKKGGIIFISGQAAIDHRTLTPTGGDVVAQARQAYRNVARVLEAAGASLADVVRTAEFITPAAVRDYGATAQVRRELFGSGFPAATGVVVSRLVGEEFLFEVDAIAVVG